MSEQIQRFLRKNKIEIEDISYITREQKRTCVHLADGRVIKTLINVKDFFVVLETYSFLSINKGTIVSTKHIEQITDGEYHMMDGSILQGRKRTQATHKRINNNLHTSYLETLDAHNISERFSILDQMPVAFCIIELTFSEDGRGIDFKFRYCNKEMEKLENKTLSEMLNQSFYKVFKNADKKWLAIYTDVALNGTKRSIQSYSPEIEKMIYISCYQPLEGFCACLLTTDDYKPKTSVL
jgi:hypothetical protein